MKHSWQNLKVKTYPQQRATAQVINALQNGHIPFRIIAPSGTYYVDTLGTHLHDWNIHTGVIVMKHMIISADTGEILVAKTSCISIMAYTRTKTFKPTWRNLK